MVSVGIRELKAHLSEYVDKAADGESVIITLRGREVATLAPLDPDRATINALISAGKARWSGETSRCGQCPVGRESRL